MLPVTLSSFEPNVKHQSLSKLTKRKLNILESSTAFSLTEKIEILLLFMHKKWIAEVDIGLKRKKDSINALKQLELPWHIESYDGPYVESWIQVGANQAVLDYVTLRRNQLSDLESGILYGFPLTHVLGYVGIIKREPRPPASVALYMLAGTYSASFQGDEIAYFERIWQKLEAISPAIAKEAQKVFEEYRNATPSAGA